MLDDTSLVAFLSMSIMPSTSPFPLMKLRSTLSATDRLQREVTYDLSFRTTHIALHIVSTLTTRRGKGHTAPPRN